MRRPLDLRLYLVTDPGLTAERGLAATVAAAVAGGATLVQLRDKEAGDAALAEAARDLAALLQPRGVPLIVNDRPEVAARARADGVHVGRNDAAAAAARRLLGPEALIGVSAATPEDAAAVDPAVADYVAASPVFFTATKGDLDPPLGLEGLRAMRAATRLPLVAIGGISEARIAEVIAAGADGVAVVSALCAAADPSAAARRLRHAVDTALAARTRTGASR